MAWQSILSCNTSVIASEARQSKNKKQNMRSPNNPKGTYIPSLRGVSGEAIQKNKSTNQTTQKNPNTKSINYQLQI
jgi:hypothetical protein